MITFSTFSFFNFCKIWPNLIGSVVVLNKFKSIALDEKSCGVFDLKQREAFVFNILGLQSLLSNLKRDGGSKNNFNIAIDKVYKKLYRKDKNWKNKKVLARFVCSLTIYWPKGKIINSVGTIKGIISKKKIGKNGFGYDPIFIPLGKKITFGQMKPSSKYKIDHRYKAFKKIKRFF